MSITAPLNKQTTLVWVKQVTVDAFVESDYEGIKLWYNKEWKYYRWTSVWLKRSLQQLVMNCPRLWKGVSAQKISGECPTDSTDFISLRFMITAMGVLMRMQDNSTKGMRNDSQFSFITWNLP